MLRFSRLDPHLLDPVCPPAVFNATLNAHGTYTTEHFVLRLSPRVYELVDAITKRETDGHDTADLMQAYSVLGENMSFACASTAGAAAANIMDVAGALRAP